MTAHQRAQDGSQGASGADGLSVDARAVLEAHTPSVFEVWKRHAAAAESVLEIACSVCGQEWGDAETGGCEVVLLARRVLVLEEAMEGLYTETVVVDPLPGLVGVPRHTWERFLRAYGADGPSHGLPAGRGPLMAFQTWVIDKNRIGIRCSGCNAHGAVVARLPTEGDINVDIDLTIKDAWCTNCLPERLRAKDGPRPIEPHACTDACLVAAADATPARRRRGR